MPRARRISNFGQTAAANSQEGGGCFSFMIPPLAVIFVGLALAFLAARAPAQTATLQTTTANPASLFTPEVDHWSASISRWANASGLDPNLVAAIMQIESCGNPFARSSAGAMGLFQVMPFHFLALDNPYDPDTNAARGLAYLKRSLEAADGNIGQALAGYNAGISAIASGARPAETVRYVYWGDGIYSDAAKGLSESPRLNEWLNAGGAGLCRQAGIKLGLN